ncbi:MAG: hypothetical protein GXO11_04265 [Epsilonproteobacteria bacterium]|nr:hypothetical protein [Campylobacterota bacterium]
MNLKTLFLTAITLLLGMIIYFLVDPSYERSLEAKYYYETSNYQEAYKLSKEAFELNPYNKMAATIMTQSQYALKYVHYINDAKKYIQQIEQIIHDEVTPQDRAKIRIISEIMIDRYKKLTPSVVIDQDLIKKAKEYYEKFQNIHKKARRIS